MGAVIRRGLTGVWDRFAASDPGLLRLMAGLRTVAAIALTLVVLAVLGTDVTHLVAGAMTAMVATFAIKEKQVRGQAVTLALGLPVALAAVSSARCCTARSSRATPSSSPSSSAPSTAAASATAAPPWA